MANRAVWNLYQCGADVRSSHEPRSIRSEALFLKGLSLAAQSHRAGRDPEMPFERAGKRLLTCKSCAHRNVADRDMSEAQVTQIGRAAVEPLLSDVRSISNPGVA